MGKTKVYTIYTSHTTRSTSQYIFHVKPEIFYSIPSSSEVDRTYDIATLHGRIEKTFLDRIKEHGSPTKAAGLKFVDSCLGVSWRYKWFNDPFKSSAKFMKSSNWVNSNISSFGSDTGSYVDHPARLRELGRYQPEACLTDSGSLPDETVITVDETSVGGVGSVNGEVVNLRSDEVGYGEQVGSSNGFEMNNRPNRTSFPVSMRSYMEGLLYLGPIIIDAETGAEGAEAELSLVGSDT